MRRISIIICKCGKEVETYRPQRTKYCSKVCKYKYYVKSSGFKRVDKTPNPSWFTKDFDPWNKNTKGVMQPNSGSFKSGEHRSPETEFKPGDNIGELNPKWSGSDPGYSAVHSRMKKKINRPDRCQWCGKIGKTDFANLSHKYKEDINDWAYLCHKCHFQYDSKAGWGDATKFIAERKAVS